MKTCVGHCHAENINLDSLLTNSDSELVKLREVVLIKSDDTEYFLFPYGVYVVWGARDHNIEKLIEKYFVDPLEESLRLKDSFEFEYVESTKLIEEDLIQLPDEDVKTRLSISHGIAQSLKLSQIEDEVVAKIKNLSHIPKMLSEQGKIKESKKNISKLRGQLYELKAKVNFNFSLLDKPEFFWENPEYDSIYTSTAEYLELIQRIEVLNKKMDVVDELLAILADELNHRHSSKLEWIIIWLIAIEFLIFLLHDVFKIV